MCVLDYINMNLRKATSVLFMLMIVVELDVVRGNVVFNVQHKYGGYRNATLSTLKAHDLHRHGRSLASLNLPVGGNGKFTATGLYYTKLAIGTPSKDYHFQIDTGSDLMWVNCEGCNNCAGKSRFGFDLQLYDVKASSTANQVSCDQDFCSLVYTRPSNCSAGKSCSFFTSYYDGSESGGYFVKDNVKFDQSSGDGKTEPVDANIGFGCSSRKTGKTGTSTDSVDGIIGLGQAKYSLISQLAMSKKINNRVFSHCFDDKKGGGIFAIGQVVDPPVKNMVPLVPKEPHYTIRMDTIEVNGKVIELEKGFFGLGSGTQTVIDSGATLAYLPSPVYEQVISLILEKQPDLKTYVYEDQFTCISYTGDADIDFPTVNFQFGNSATMKVYPSEYLVQISPDEWCLGWQKSGLTENGETVILLGDLALSNKLVVYDLEKQEIGWTPYSCTESIKVKDEATGNAYAMNANSIHYSSSPSSQNGLNSWTFSFLIGAVYYLLMK